MTSLSARSSKGFNVTLGSFLSRKPASPFSSFLGLFPWLIIFFYYVLQQSTVLGNL